MILHIEDDVIFYRTITRVLRPRDVRHAGTLDEGRNRIEELHPDLVLLDWWLPDGFAREILPWIAARAPVIVMTGEDDREVFNDSMVMGAVAVIAKDELSLTLVRVVAAVEHGGLVSAVASAAEPDSLTASRHRRLLV